jgi:hypothetical protein
MKSSASPDGDPGIIEHQARFVVDQAGPEAEGGSGVVITLAGGLAGDSHIGLLQPLHGQADSADVGGGGGRLSPDMRAKGGPGWTMVLAGC